MAGTEHPRIMQAREDYLPTVELAPLLEELQRTTAALDCCSVRDTLIRAVREYRPENGVDDLLCDKQLASVEEDRKVVSIEKGTRLAAGAEPPNA